MAPLHPSAVPRRTRCTTSRRTGAHDGETRRESKKGGQTGKRRSAGMVLMHKTCIFTKPVFTDVNTRYARETRGGRVAAGGERRGGGLARRGPRNAIYLFYPGGWSGENSFAARGCALRTSARGVYLTGARTCDAESADPPRP